MEKEQTQRTMQQQIEKAVQEHLRALQRHSSNPHVNENIADESTVTQVPRKTQEKTFPGQPPTVAASPVTIDRFREFEMKQDQRYQELTSMLMSFLQDQRSDSSAGTGKRPAIIDLTDAATELASDGLRLGVMSVLCGPQLTPLL
jgi:hypothetical protein